MKQHLGLIWIGVTGLALLVTEAVGQTEGAARLAATLVDYNGSGAAHWTVVWVTTESGDFLKTLRRQGPSLTSSKWNSHCRTWYNARGSSTSFDGYSSATATTYTGTNSPIILTWDGRDGGNNLVPDGKYKFWVQYAEDSGQGPWTTDGLLWTKGPSGATNSYPNQEPNFRNLEVVWTPVPPPPPPVIGLVRLEDSRLLMGGTGPANKRFYTLFSARAGLPLAQWTPMATNSFDGQGTFLTTNAVPSGNGAAFYRLQVP